ncbi:MAG: hypothetical protein IKD18_05060 [Clostridia bacterium]|nr:hypothetical protein [Clostridia bacterium]
MKATKILSLILALIMLCSCFLAACGSEEEKGQVGGEVAINTDGVDETKVLDLPKLGANGFNGHEFRFLSRKVNHESLKTYEIYAESLTGDKLNDAVFTRNSQIEKAYNCKIVEEQVSSPANAAMEPLMAGEYYADILFDEARLLRGLAGKNLLADFSVMENTNLEKAWYDKNSLSGMNIGSKVFFLVGDAATLDDRCTWIMWFNRDHIEEYDSEINLYDEVRAGKWTLDRLYELMVATAKDLNGDGYLMPGEDRFGYICERYGNFGHVLACGVTIGTVDDAGTWVIPTTPKQELIDAWAALKPVLTSPTRFVSSNIESFSKGLGTFYSAGIGSALSLGDSTYRIGALPMPKQNEEQELYLSGVGYSQLCAYSIPNTVEGAEDWATNGFASGSEQVAYFFEVFSYYSMNLLTPAFYNQVLLKQSVSDPESAEMIEIAMQNKVYDPIAGYNFGSINVYSHVGSNHQNGIPGTDVNYDTLVSAYEAKVAAARKALQQYIRFTDYQSGDVV